MWLATRHEGFDGASIGSRRLPIGLPSKLIERWTKGYLRFGLALQVLALLVAIVSHYAFNGEGFFTWDMRNTTSQMRTRNDFRYWNLFCCALYFLGALYILCFQAGLADDVAWARGYRAGSKLLSYATFFDVLAAALQMAGALNFAHNYCESYWTHYRAGSLDWIFGAGARAIHGIGFMLMGAAFFFLEVYHDAGTNDWHGRANFILFGVAGLSVLFLKDPSVGPLFGLIALASGTLWALAFEDEVTSSCPALHETELCNELERNIDEYTRMNPTGPAY